MDVLTLNGELVKSLVNRNDAIQIIENSFTQFQVGKSHNYPAIREMIPEHNGIFGIKSSYLEDVESIGLKAGGYWRNNTKTGRSNHQSTMVLFNPATGEPVCFLNANYLTGIRTGAAGAVAAKHLAKKDSEAIALIGTGEQAMYQFESIQHVVPSIKTAYLYNHHASYPQRFLDKIRSFGVEIICKDSAKEAVHSADIVVTTTPTFKPVLKTSWLKKGAHINAVGSDTSGKREIHIDCLPDKLICDYWPQASTMGECQHDVAFDSLYAEIGEITRGSKPGRQYEKEVTFFDSTGLAIQDLSIAFFVYKKAQELQEGTLIKI